MGQSVSAAKDLVNDVKSAVDSESLEAIMEALKKITSVAAGNDEMIDALVRNKLIEVLVACLKQSQDVTRAEAAKALSIIADSPKISSVFVQCGGIYPVVMLGLSTEISTQLQSARLMATLARYKESRKALRDAQALNALVIMALAIKTDVQHEAVRAIGNMSIDSELQSDIIDAGALRPLLTLLSSKHPGTARQAIRAIANLAEDINNQKKIVQEGGLIYIVRLLRSKDTDLHRDAARAICNLARLMENQSKIRLTGAITALIDLAKTRNDAGIAASAALLQLCYHDLNQEEILKNKGLELILQIVKTSDIDQLRASSTNLSYFAQEAPSAKQQQIILALIGPVLSLVAHRDPIVYKMAVRSLSHFSLRSDCQREIVLQDGVRVLIERARTAGIEDIVKLECVRTLTNLALCLETHDQLRATNYIDFFLELQHSTNSDISAEARLALGNLPNAVESADPTDLLMFFVTLCESPDIHIQCKATGALANLAAQHQIRDTVAIKALDVIINMTGSSAVSVRREAARALANITRQPDGLICWLKFDSPLASVDSSCNLYPAVSGNPQRLPAKKGLHGNWGAMFASSDAIFLQKDGLSVAGKKGQPPEWTVTVWFIAPLPNTGRWHTLLQSCHGVGGQIVVHSNQKEVGFFDDSKDGSFVSMGIDVSKLQAGWHHLAVVAGKSRTTFYIDGERKGSTGSQCVGDFFSVGNCVDGNEPFGTICDFRIYPHCLDPADIKTIFRYKTEPLPDLYCRMVMERGGVPPLVDILKCGVAGAQIPAARALCCLATYVPCRVQIIRCGGLVELAGLVNSPVPELAREAMRALVFLC
eukprot:GILK01011208.1.p1 GENE.GILK01011208.1~~GILK01011208.1.p1  ORF type:complete len:824 (+),score=157.38 GILK01011208.1:80-2551(+)